MKTFAATTVVEPTGAIRVAGVPFSAGTEVEVVVSPKRTLSGNEGRPPGAPPDRLLRMAGTIPISDCLEIEEAIEEGCGQADVNAW